MIATQSTAKTIVARVPPRHGSRRRERTLLPDGWFRTDLEQVMSEDGSTVRIAARVTGPRDVMPVIGGIATLFLDGRAVASGMLDGDARASLETRIGCVEPATFHDLQVHVAGTFVPLAGWAALDFESIQCEILEF